MKRVLVALILVGGIAAVSFATLNTARKKVQLEKKTEKQEKKKECKHTCLFS